MKKVRYISLVWSVMLVVILAPYMIHHHHYDGMCMIQDISTLDGNIKNQHSSRSRNEENACPLQQIRNFISNVKCVQNTSDALMSYVPYSSAILTNTMNDYYSLDYSIVDRFYPTTQLIKAETAAYLRRGPPVL